MCKIKISALLFIVVVLLASCKGELKTRYNPEQDPISGIASIVILKPGENVIEMSDFILDFSGIDSISYESSNYSYDKEKQQLIIKEKFEDLAPLSQIIVSNKGKLYSVICRKINKIKTEIIFKPESGTEYSQVSVAGDFNGWSATANILEHDGDFWKTNLNLDEGLYQYQIVADGKWMNNSSAGDTVSNGIGGYNTLLMAFDDSDKHKLALDTYSYDEKSITITASVIPDKLYILWQNQIVPINLANFESDRYTFEIPEEAASVKRSYIRVYAYKENDISNDLLIPLQNGIVLTDVAEITRADKFSNIMYFVLVDRFCNGTLLNDVKVKDPRVSDKANYQGGDLYGVLYKSKEGYFDKLGVNCIWISPVFKNPDEAYQEFPEPRRYFSGYHGYWPVSTVEIDYRLGNDSVFEALVGSIHDKNMNIILDFVANHVHQNHPLYQNNKDWATPLTLPDGRQNIRLWDEYRLTTWFDTFLPSWDFENPEVSDTVSELAMFWVNKFGIDGFRHDATKHIPEVFWRLLTKKIKTEYPDKSIFQIGETFGNRELIADYIGSGMMDGQFDFNLYFDARNCFGNSCCDMKNLALSLNTSLDYYGHHNLMGNITGNHDLIRFITFADGSVLPGEDEKEAGWNRDIVVKNPNSYKKLQSLTAFMMSIPGVPCIYYGDEIGLPGAGDPDNRRMMKFNNLSIEEQETFNVTAKLTAIRRNNIEFIFGTTTVIDAGMSQLIIKRKYFDKVSYIIFNQSDSVMDFVIPKTEIQDISKFEQNFGAEISERDSGYKIKINPFSFEILVGQK